MRKKRKLYVLLVGINDYQYISALSGCIYDAERMQDYLLDWAGDDFEVAIKLLVNKKATKAGIVKAFKKHLGKGKAKEGDVLLFYFSGHGAQEEAHAIFENSEPDKKLEVLACYDSNLETGSNFLADKELRYLIHKVTKNGAFLVSIFDCCHAGDNTRGKLKRLVEQVPLRDWSDFIFESEVTIRDIQESSLNDALPQGNHIQLAASEAHELSYEGRLGGAFTTALLKLLYEIQGDISYFDLWRKLRYRLPLSSSQTPYMYVRSNDPKVLYKTFLSGVFKGKPVGGNAFYNPTKKRWELDLGGIHGLKRQSLVKIKNVEQAVLVEEVSTSSSVLKTPIGFNLDTNKTYTVYVPGLMSNKINLVLQGEKAGTHLFSKTFEKLRAAYKGGAIELVGEGINADIKIKAYKGKYLILDCKKNLLLRSPISGYTSDAVEEVYRSLLHIGRWKFIKKLENPNTNLIEETPIKLEVSQNGKTVFSGKQGIVRLNLITNDPSGQNHLRLKLTNTSNKTLYIACLYLSTRFEVIPSFLEGNVVRLKPKESIFAQGGRAFPFKLDNFVKQFNWPTEELFLKVIGSTKSFSVTRFEQGSLDQLDVMRAAKDMQESIQVEDKDDWTTQSFTVRIPNLGFLAQK